MTDGFQLWNTYQTKSGWQGFQNVSSIPVTLIDQKEYLLPDKWKSYDIKISITELPAFHIINIKRYFGRGRANLPPRRYFQTTLQWRSLHGNEAFWLLGGFSAPSPTEYVVSLAPTTLRPMGTALTKGHLIFDTWCKMIFALSEFHGHFYITTTFNTNNHQGWYHRPRLIMVMYFRSLINL